MMYKEDEISIGMWVGVLILMAIPYLNIVVILAIAFAGDNETLKNFGKAMLIIQILSFLLGLLF